MAHDNFQTALLRLLAAEMWTLISMNAAREMFGKSYFALGVAEKSALDHMIASNIASNFGGISPEFLRSPQPQPLVAGFSPSDVKR